VLHCRPDRRRFDHRSAGSDCPGGGVSSTATRIPSLRRWNGVPVFERYASSIDQKTGTWMLVEPNNTVLANRPLRQLLPPDGGRCCPR
jgi:hypothetical protein